MKFTRCSVVFAFVIASCNVTYAAEASPRLLADSFDGTQNQLRGYRNTFELEPSKASCKRTPNASVGRNGLGMQITAEREDFGYCGLWIHFFDHTAAEPKYLDVSQARYLSFWVRGTAGGEQFTVRLADDDWIAEDDSVAIGGIDEFLMGGVTQDWQQVFVPLSEAHSLNLQRLGGLILNFDTPSKAIVCIDEIEFCVTRATQTNGNQPDRRRLVAVQKAPALQETPASLSAGVNTLRDDSGIHAKTVANVDWYLQNNAGPSELSPGRALWLWQTKQLLDSQLETKRFIDFCQEQRIKTVWAQLPYTIDSPPAMQSTEDGSLAGATHCRIEREQDLRQLIRLVHGAGIRIHALDGDPQFAQARFHHLPLSIVDAVLQFNDGHPTAEQFDGIHFDNEPYLLTLWHDPSGREQILREFLELNRECQRRVSGTWPRVQFGVDIPFWLQDQDSYGKTIGAVTFEGERKSASYHLLDIVDNVGVMNYRDAALGADGMIAHAAKLLQYADESGGVELYLGVETHSAEPTRVWFAVGQSRQEFQAAVRGPASHYAALSHIAGNRLRVVSDDDHIHVGIDVDRFALASNENPAIEAICRVASAFGANPRKAAATQSSLIGLLRRDPQWSNIKPVVINDSVMAFPHLIVQADATMPDKLTFADESWPYFLSQTQLAEYQFKKHLSFAGLAIHDYRSCKLMRDRAAELPGQKMTRPTSRRGWQTLTSAK
ncbi:hypothetical protein [Stieleria marina]